MKSLLDQSAKAEVFGRINKLTPETQRLWGKMNVAQMLVHCAIATEYACGDHPAKQVFIGKIFGTPFKAGFYNEKPFGKNLPTSPKFVVVDDREFEKEKNRLMQTIDRFTSGGPAGVTKYPHQWYGPLTPEQWGMGMYKHLDHHLKQFGV